jgi:hypothetical protein
MELQQTEVGIGIDFSVGSLRLKKRDGDSC